MGAATPSFKCKLPYDDPDFLDRQVRGLRERIEALRAGKISSVRYETHMVDCAVMGRQLRDFEYMTIAILESTHRSANVEIRTYKLLEEVRPSGFFHAMVTAIDGRITSISWSN